MTESATEPPDAVADAVLALTVHEAISSVDDPEYPGVSIVDLGLLEKLEVCAHDGTVTVGLIPTFSGCPALALIREDVEAAVAALPDVNHVNVEWLDAPVWTVQRLSAETRRQLATEFTVAVRIGSAPPACPRCSGPTEEQSLFGPSRCRSVNRCASCSETVEVMRS